MPRQGFQMSCKVVEVFRADVLKGGVSKEREYPGDQNILEILLRRFLTDFGFDMRQPILLGILTQCHLAIGVSDELVLPATLREMA